MIHINAYTKYIHVYVCVYILYNIYRRMKLTFTFPIFPQLGKLLPRQKSPPFQERHRPTQLALTVTNRPGRDRNQDTQRNGDFIDINVKDLLISVEVFMVFICILPFYIPIHTLCNFKTQHKHTSCTRMQKKTHPCHRGAALGGGGEPNIIIYIYMPTISEYGPWVAVYTTLSNTFDGLTNPSTGPVKSWSPSGRIKYDFESVTYAYLAMVQIYWTPKIDRSKS